MNAQVLSTLTVATPSNDAAPLFPAEHVVARLFLDARTHGAFLDRPVDDALLRRVYEAARMGPTAANSVPMRIVFVKSAEPKERLRPTLSAGNVDKTMKAPVTAIRCTRACRASRSKRPAESSEGSHDAASILA